MQRDPLPARRRYTRLAGSADALALARLAQEEHPIAVVGATAFDAQRLLDEIQWFSPQLRVCLLPDWETLPYDQFSPHHDLVSERLATADGLTVGSRITLQGLGDSARVTLRLLAEDRTDTTTIAKDILDTGSYSWVVPTGVAPEYGHFVEIMHTAGYYGVDYHDVGKDQSDDFLTILPVPVNNLVARAGKTTMTLVWSEPGQLPNEDATNYAIRFSLTAPVSESTWSGCTPIGNPDRPGPAGTGHCLDLIVTPCRTYYFGIRTYRYGVWSRISNVATANTVCSGNRGYFCAGDGLIADGGPGGNPVRTRRLDTAAASGGVVAADSDLAVPSENSLLWRTSRGQVTDLYKYSAGIGAAGSQYSVGMRETGDKAAQIDQAILGLVDHLPSTEVYAGRGEVFLGASGPVASVQDALGSPVVALSGAPSDSGYDVADGDWLNVNLGPSTGPRAVVIRSTEPAPQSATDSSGIWVQVPASDSTWQSTGVVHPRKGFDDYAVDIGANTNLRLLFRGSYTVGSVRALLVSGHVIPQALALSSATHSRLGDVSNLINQVGGGTTGLDPGDSLSLAFQATPVPPGEARDLFLTTTGSYVIPSAEEPLVPAASPASVVAAFSFELGPARPNPSVGSDLRLLPRTSSGGGA